MRARTFAGSFQARVYGTDHRLHRRYETVGAEQHLGGGDEVRQVATRPRASIKIADAGSSPIRNHGCRDV